MGPTPPSGQSSSLGNIGAAVDQHIQATSGNLNSPFAQFANTPNAMLGVAGNWATSVGATATAWSNINEPATKGGPPPTKGEKAARVLRATQQTAGAVMGALGLAKQALDVGFANLSAPLNAIYPSFPAATLSTGYVGTPHCHPLHPPSGPPPIPPTPLPSIGMAMLSLSVKVLINGMPAARVDDIGLAPTCCGIPPAWFKIKTGSANVFIGGVRAARFGDICKACPAVPDSPAAGALSAIGKVASMAAKALAAGGVVVGALGIAADVAEMAVATSQAEADNKAMDAALSSAQIAADAAKMVAEKLMWMDKALPPTGSIGAIVDPSHMNVRIGGIPMINIPDPVGALLNRLQRYKVPDEEGESPKVGSAACH